MSGHIQRLLFALFGLTLSFISFSVACKKTDSPLGLVAPNGFDVPTLTPTPQTGAIEVYVKDSGVVSSGALQGVSIYLIQPGGVTFGVNTTQPVVGYAAFNPSNLINGIWNAVVPSQAVSYQIVSSGVTTTVKRTYGTSSLPITISGGGQYAATFATGGNAVALSPVTQFWSFTSPQFVPFTATYSETGNLDVPVSVTMSGLPALSYLNYQNPNSWQFGGANPYFSSVTISRTSCYYIPVTFTLTAFDLSGNPIPTTGAFIEDTATYPVTALICKHANGGGVEVFEFEVQEPAGASSNYCSPPPYLINYVIGTSNPPTGTSRAISFVGNTIQQSVTYSGSVDPYVNATLTIPGGHTLNVDVQAQSLSFDSFQSFGISSW